MAKRGRKPATGRFDDRQSLEAFVWREYDSTSRSTSQIARHARVSEAVVQRILTKRPGS